MGLPIISNTLTKVSYFCVEIGDNTFFVQNVVKWDWKNKKVFKIKSPFPTSDDKFKENRLHT